MHTHFLISANRDHQSEICSEGYRCLESVRYVCNTNERGTREKISFALLERGASQGAACKGICGSCCISMQCLVYSPGVIKGLDFLCLLVDSYASLHLRTTEFFRIVHGDMWPAISSFYLPAHPNT